jgi:cytochrome c
MKIALPLLTALLAGACASSDPNPPPTNAWQSQVQRGADVFADNCAKCHGKSGQGSKKAPALAGSGALPVNPRPESKRKTQFHTAMDVAAFVKSNMPPEAEDRAELTEAMYWDVLAFALSANGVKREQPVGSHNAAQIQLH